jgi:ankyrin repeat protein
MKRFLFSYACRFMQDGSAGGRSYRNVRRHRSSVDIRDEPEPSLRSNAVIRCVHTLIAVLALLLAGCDRGAQEAKSELASKQIAYDLATFEKYVASRDQNVTKLFCTAGLLDELHRDDKNMLLFEAIENGLDGLVKALLESGADPNCIGARGMLPLLMSVKKGDHNISRLLLSYGAFADTQSPVNPESALNYTAGHNDLEHVRLLLEFGAGVTPGEGERTVLMIAARQGHAAVMQALIDNGADVNFPEGRPLHLAVFSQNPDAVILLLRYGAVPLADDRGCTPLHYAAAEQPLKVVIALMNAGASADAYCRGSSFHTPLEWAKNNNQENYEYLLSLRALKQADEQTGRVKSEWVGAVN